MTDSLMRDWQFYFKKADGTSNRSNVIRAFTSFWGDEPEKQQLVLPGKCVLGGKIFRREGFHDGEEIFTPTVKTVERITKKYDKNGITHDLMCITTVSGSKYYIYADGYSARMGMMIGDMITDGYLNGQKNFYLKRRYRGAEFL